ncbi:hypothetical protein LXL04_035008 [Taraxacum kok-saghyz]
MGMGRGRGRGRGATTAPAAAPSGYGSSNSNRIRAQGHGQGGTTNVVTREELANEIARAIQATMPNVIAQARDALLNVNDDNMGGGEDDQEYYMPNPNPSVDQPAGVNNNHERRGCSYKTFMTCKPPVFDGEPDPIKSTRWITEIEGTFDTSKYADEDRVVYAVTMLKNEAIYWCGMVKEVRERDVAKRMKWDEFIKIFKETFCPRTAIKQLEEEFLKLEQGNMMVREYTTKIIEKARFANFMYPKPDTFKSAVDAAEGREREKNRQGEDRASGKRKLEVTNNEFKKGRTSSPEQPVISVGSQDTLLRSVRREECAMDVDPQTTSSQNVPGTKIDIMVVRTGYMMGGSKWIRTMDPGKRITKSEVPSVGTSGLLPYKKSRDRVEPSDSEGEVEPLSPLNLSERDEEEYPEEDPEEDPEEEPEEDPEEEPEEDPDEPAWPIPVVPHEGESEGNLANSSPSYTPATPRSGNSDENPWAREYETFHMPYVEYTPTSPGFYWKQLYHEDMPKATSEIHDLKRKLEERDAYVTRLEKEKQEWIRDKVDHRTKIRTLNMEIPKAATYSLIDWVARRDPPKPEVLIYGNGPGDVKGRKIRKYLREGKRILKYEDIVFKK